MFAQQAHLRLNHIPYKGSAQAVQAVLANQVPMTFGDSAAVIAQIRAGKLRALAVTTGKRIASLPEVPTVDEAGVPGYEILLWSGLFAPAGTPAPVVAALQAGVRQALHDPKMQASLGKLGIEPIGSSAAELEATIKRQIAQYTKVAKQADISIQ